MLFFFVEIIFPLSLYDVCDLFIKASGLLPGPSALSDILVTYNLWETHTFILLSHFFPPFPYNKNICVIATWSEHIIATYESPTLSSPPFAINCYVWLVLTSSSLDSFHSLLGRAEVAVRKPPQEGRGARHSLNSCMSKLAFLQTNT